MSSMVVGIRDGVRFGFRRWRLFGYRCIMMLVDRGEGVGKR